MSQKKSIRSCNGDVTRISDWSESPPPPPPPPPSILIHAELHVDPGSSSMDRYGKWMVQCSCPADHLQCGPNAPPREWMQCLSRCSCPADPVLGPPVWTQCTSQGVDAMPQLILMPCRSRPGTSSVDPMHLPGSGCNASADAHVLQMIHADPICMHRHLAQRGCAPREWNAVPQLMSSQAPICMHR